MFCGLKIFLERVKYYSHVSLPLNLILFFPLFTSIKSNLDLSDLSLSLCVTYTSFFLSSFLTLQLSRRSVSPYSVTVHSSTTSTNLASFGQYANLFLLRWSLTSLSLNIASNHQLYLIWSLISTPLPDHSFPLALAYRSLISFYHFLSFMNIFYRLCYWLLFSLSSNFGVLVILL